MVVVVRLADQRLWVPVRSAPGLDPAGAWGRWHRHCDGTAHGMAAPAPHGQPSGACPGVHASNERHDFEPIRVAHIRSSWLEQQYPRLLCKQRRIKVQVGKQATVKS